jgi:hypothetical protein
MSKFKIGDTVRILCSHGSDLEVGSEHVIDKACFGSWYEIADFYFHGEHLELVEIKEEFL